MMNEALFRDMVILEMANNHMGDPDHGKNIIRAFAPLVHDFPSFRFVFKFQFRNLPTFIHRDWQDRLDIKYIKRFQETALSDADFEQMKKEAEKNGFLTACTPFDETSVDKVIRMKFDILKIASCSFNDWPLLEKAAGSGLPMVLSTAGASKENIDNVAAFLQHRNINFAMMHCVGSYPTPEENLELNQIDYFKQLYEGVPIGFSTHESPENMLPVMLAAAKGASILERHVGLPTEKYKLNAYSSAPEQIRAWLSAALRAKAICGVTGKRRDISEKETSDLQGLQRGVFLKHDVPAGKKIVKEDLYFAIPCQTGQMRANDYSKYLEIIPQTALKADQGLMLSEIELVNRRDEVLKNIRKVVDILKRSGLRLSCRMDLELSHHYGLEQFERTGCAIITCVNREYCKKIIVVLPGQRNPVHTHHKKEETFHILYGDLKLGLNGTEKICHAGEIVVVERGVAHDFSSETGAVLEEISTTHFRNDSFYDDPKIAGPDERKTYMTFFPEWLNNAGEDIQ